jgi:hypothetical protein
MDRGASTVVTVLSELFDGLAAARPETAEEMAQAIQQQFREYREFADDHAKNTWLAGLHATLALFVEVGRADRSLDAREQRRISAVGGTRAEQGVPLEVVLGSVRLAMHVALSAVRRHAHELRDASGFEEAMDEMSLRMTGFVNEFSTQISKGYVARSEARATSAERDRTQFGSALLAGAFPTYRDVVNQAEVLGFTVPPTLRLVLLPGPDATHALLAADLGDILPSVLVVPIGWGRDPHTVLIVPAGAGDDWVKASKRIGEVLARHRATALAVGPCEDPQELHRRYVEAAACLAFVPAFAADRPIVDAAELVPAQFVAAAPRVALQAIDRGVLSPLREHRKGPKLLRALDALMREGGSPKGAARVLGVAAETARTYKATIEEVTRLRFDCPTEAMRLGLGWLVLRQFGENGFA